MTVDYQLITQDASGNINNIDAGLITDGTTADTSKPFRNIRIAFESLFNTMTGGGQLNFTHKVFENTDFNISDVVKTNLNAEWVVGSLIPGDTVASTMGASGRDISVGIFQIDYYAKTGIGGYTERLDSIANYFSRGSTLTANGTEVRIENVSLGVGRRDGAFFVRNVDVSYFAVTAARS
tara:strand:- start:16006 stop:16545 length:540 start_codon:yes stop_codon:yes gene_type:complete